MKPMSSSHLLFKNSINDDPNPPIAANYMSSDSISQAWSSVVFHCPVGNPAARLFCAKLSPIGTVTYSPSVSPTISPSSIPTTVVATKAPTSTPTIAPSTAVVSPSGNVLGNFKASIVSGNASGAVGYFAMSVNADGKGSYKFSINLNNFTSKLCSAAVLATGLKCK